MDSLYIADHLLRIEEEFCDRPGSRLDSLWRIASNIELFGRELESGELTPQQLLALERWLAEFRQSRQGQRAIARIQAARAAGYRQSPSPESVLA